MRAVCNPGEGLGNDGICRKCSVGSYGVAAMMPAYNATPCAKCLYGWSTSSFPATRAADCDVCKAGFGGFKTAVGGFTCNVCKAGEYANGGDSMSYYVGCKACAAGYTSPPAWTNCPSEHGPGEGRFQHPPPRRGGGGVRAGWPQWGRGEAGRAGARRPDACPHERDAPRLGAPFAPPRAVAQRLCRGGRPAAPRAHPARLPPPSVPPSVRPWVRYGWEIWDMPPL